MTTMLSDLYNKKGTQRNGRFVILPKCKGCQHCQSIAHENIIYDTATGKCTICEQPVEDAEVNAFLKAHYGCPNDAFRDKTDVADESMD